MLPAAPRPASAVQHTTNTNTDASASPAGIPRQDSAPAALLAYTPSSPENCFVTKPSSPRPAVGAGSAAAKASRERRTNSARDSPLQSGRSSAATSFVMDSHFSHHGGGMPDKSPAGATQASALTSHPPLATGVSGPSEESNGNNVQLLQQLQKLLLDGASPAVLQQWVSGRLQHAAAATAQHGGDADPQSPQISGSAASLPGGAQPGPDSYVPFPTPTSRRPNSAVSFSFLSAYPHSTQASLQGTPLCTAAAAAAGGVGGGAALRGTSPAAGAEEHGFLPTTPMLPPQPPASLAAVKAAAAAVNAHRTGSAAANSSSSGSTISSNRHLGPGGVTPLEADMGMAEGSTSSNTNAVSPRSGALPAPLPSPQVFLSPYTGSTPPLPDIGMDGQHQLVLLPSMSNSGAGGRNSSESDGNASHLSVRQRQGSLSVTSPTPNHTSGAAENSAFANVSGSGAAAAAGSAGGLLRASNRSAGQSPQKQQQQRRSFHRGGAVSELTLNGTRGHTALMSASATSPTSTGSAAAGAATSFSPTSASSTSRRAHEASLLHDATKAAVHATTSKMLADEQRSISLMLGERFSRKPESLVRRLATPPSAQSISVVGLINLDGHSHHRGSVSGVGDSCLTSTAYNDRSDFAMHASQSQSLPPPIMGVATVPLMYGGNSSVTSAYAEAEAGALAAAAQAASEHVSVGHHAKTGHRHSAETAPAVSDTSSASVAISTPSTPACATPQSIVSPSASLRSSTRAARIPASVKPLSGVSSGAVVPSPHQRQAVSGGGGPVLSCEDEALFPSPSPLASPAAAASATASMRKHAAAAAAAHRNEGDAYQHNPHSHPVHNRTPSAVVAAALPSPVTPLSPAAAGGGGMLHHSSKRPTMVEILPLVEVDVDAAAAIGSSSSTTTMTDSASTTSSVRGGNGGGVVIVPDSTADGTVSGNPTRAWGGGGPTTTTIPAVNVNASSATSLAWMQSSLSGVGANQFLQSPSFMTGGNGGNHHHQPTHHHHRGAHSSMRTASFVSNASSHLGNGGWGHSSTSSMGFAPQGVGRSFLSVGDELGSFDSSRTSSTRDGCRLRHSAVLHLSRSSVNGGIDPHMDGIMPAFVLDGGIRKPGPLFLRSYCRHTPVRAAESVTHALLNELQIPFLEGIEDASCLTNILHLMETYGYTDSRAFYVVVCLNVLLRYELVQRFAWQPQKLKRFFEEAATYFREGNPFHHPVHAADAVLATHQWLSEGSTAASLSDEELAAFLLTAVSLQLAHTGADNRLLTHLRHPYAMLCSYASPQQGAIVALVMALLEQPELRFFPTPSSFDISTAATMRATEEGGCTHDETKDGDDDGCGAAERPRAAHDWTASCQTQVYDMLAELLMATDERNHAALRQGIMQMGEENAQRHGCLCGGGGGGSNTSLQGPHSRGSGTSPFGLTPQKTHRSGSLTSSLAASPPPPPGPGNFCQHCCAYITDNHVPDVLKAVLHFIDYAFVFRPYEIYVTGALMYTAEVYRQSETEYLLLQSQLVTPEQLQLLTSPLPSAQQSATAGAFAAASAAAAGSVPASKRVSTSSVFPSLANTVSGRDCADVETAATEAFASVMLAEQQPWRQGVAHASTITSLQLGQGEKAASQPSSRRTTKSEWSPRPSVTYTEPQLEGSATATPAESPAGLPFAKVTARVNPLRGYGRSILLICVEDMCLPLLQYLAPYLPEAWVTASYHNHQTFLSTMPSSEEFDAVVSRLLDLAEEPLEETFRDPMQEEPNVPSAPIPWAALRRTCPINPEWSLNKDGLVQRVLQTVLQGTERRLAVSEA